MTSMHASHVPLSTYSETPDAVRNAAKQPSKLVWGDILMWKQPLQSATLFIAGLAGFGLLTFAAYGAHNMTLMSGRGRSNTHSGPHQHAYDGLLALMRTLMQQVLPCGLVLSVQCSTCCTRLASYLPAYLPALPQLRADCQMHQWMHIH
jgi:hypothetical protein